MKNTMRILALTLALLMLVLAFAACGAKTETPVNEETTKQGQGNDETTPGSVKETETEAPKSAWEVFQDQHKSETLSDKYKDEDFVVSTYPDDEQIWGDVDWVGTDMTGDVIGDAVYTRNSMVEELYGITVVAEPREDYASYTGLQREIQSGLSSADLINLPSKNALILAQQELLQNFNQYEGIKLDSEWWDQNIINDLSIGDTCFVLTGDIGTMYKKSIAVIMFNKELLETVDYSEIGNPYALRHNRLWTIEKMVELGQLVSEDMNSDDQYDENDRYGLIYFCNIASSAMIGAGVKYTTKNSDGIPELTFYDETTVDILYELSELLYEKTLAWSWNANGKNEDTAFKMFQQDQGLFYYGELHAVATMRSMVSNFGILPMPLFDDAQESYHHTVNPDVAAFYVVPVTNEDSERTGLIMDALGAASRDYLTEAYYEKVLMGRVTRDEESRETLDIVINTINYDIGIQADIGIAEMMKKLVDSCKTDLAGEWSSQEGPIQSKLDDILKAFGVE